MNNNSESPGDCAISDNEESNAFGTGKEVRKFFSGMGWYSGTVESSIQQLGGSKTYTVWFECVKYDGQSDEELACNNEESRIAIGKVEFKFICKFVGAGFFNVKVTKIIY